MNDQTNRCKGHFKMPQWKAYLFANQSLQYLFCRLRPKNSPIRWLHGIYKKWLIEKQWYGKAAAEWKAEMVVWSKRRARSLFLPKEVQYETNLRQKKCSQHVYSSVLDFCRPHELLTTIDTCSSLFCQYYRVEIFIPCIEKHLLDFFLIRRTPRRKSRSAFDNHMCDLVPVLLHAKKELFWCVPVSRR